MFNDTREGTEPGLTALASRDRRRSRRLLPRWTEEHAHRWHDAQPWLVGANYVPAAAANQVEMWGGDHFDPQAIDRELGWASVLGMNTMRVFLTDLLWEDDADGFVARIGAFLDIAARHRIRPLFVLFDSCWDAEPHLGPRPAPAHGVHNAGWLQSPGEPALFDLSQWPRLRRYVEGVVGAFARDPRVLGWDIWNEPCNPGNPHRDNPRAAAKCDAVADLLPLAFGWARAAGPAQPLTSGLWQHDDWSPDAALTPVEAIQVAQSDVLSFHDYGDAVQFARRAGQLARFGRPVLCTEWLARSTGSTVEAILPLARRLRVGMYNWGLVAGRTQTTLPWHSWVEPIAATPDHWFHDLLRADGRPFSLREAATIRALARMPLARAA